MGFSFIHIADIHLGRPFSDLQLLTDKMQICNQACENSFNKIIDIAIDTKVDFVLIAGDSFDNNEHDLHTKLCFTRSLERLAKNGIKSFVVCGNHDPIELYKKYNTYFQFDTKYNEIINITGVTTETNCHEYSFDNINIHTYSFEKEESSNPTKSLRSLTSEDSTTFNIGLFHCDLDKTDSKYGACSREDLRNLGYDYYALGHIHIPEDKDNIVYAGSIQGRTKKETGEHGCYYIKVDNSNVQKIIEKQFIPTDFVRFTEKEIDCSEYENRKDVFEAIQETVNSLPEDNTELTLFEINLNGISDAYEDLNTSENLVKEFNDEYENLAQNNCVYKINNFTTPNIDETELKEDNGIIGIISNSFSENSDIDINKIYDDISAIHENIYKKLGLDSESKEELLKTLQEQKQETIAQAEKETLALCKEIYTMD
ncbi:MAG: DNA repair exonuclease [Candidatus Gastranaerophilales bacterium]|nr:DNA repair exonuclease [Candidatus Gastranaerophilales bacterium]